MATTAPGSSKRRTARPPHSPPGDCETAIYILAGDAEFTWGPTDVESELRATTGDFVYIPAGEVHVERNPSTTDDLVVLVARNCADAVTIYVDNQEQE